MVQRGSAGEESGSAAVKASLSFEATTRVADAVAADPAIIERLAALHPTLRRLCDADERKSMGGVGTLGDAAERVGVPVADLVHAANARSPVACQATYRDAPEEETPDWMGQFDEPGARRLDVRPLIAEGREPFTPIMTAVAAVPVCGSLIIDAPFNPLPLRELLAHRDFATFGRRLSDEHWRIYCLHGLSFLDSGQGNAHRPTSDEQGARIWRAADGVHIDARHLQAPAPLVAILRLIDGSNHSGVVVAHLRRDPVFLYPELVERGWSWANVPGEPGEVRLLLRKAGT